jgi:hypothetical protein
MSTEYRYILPGSVPTVALLLTPPSYLRRCTSARLTPLLTYSANRSFRSLGQYPTVESAAGLRATYRPVSAT